MAEAKRTVERPISPHLSIYRPQINMVMSIVHRITGMPYSLATHARDVYLSQPKLLRNRHCPSPNGIRF